MLYREIIAVCSHIHAKHINMLCGQNVEFLNVKRSCTCMEQSPGFSGLKIPVCVSLPSENLSLLQDYIDEINSGQGFYINMDPILDDPIYMYI
jgi:hypothetical protein